MPVCPPDPPEPKFVDELNDVIQDATEKSLELWQKWYLPEIEKRIKAIAATGKTEILIPLKGTYRIYTPFNRHPRRTYWGPVGYYDHDGIFMRELKYRVKILSKELQIKFLVDWCKSNGFDYNIKSPQLSVLININPENI